MRIAFCLPFLLLLGCPAPAPPTDLVAATEGREDVNSAAVAYLEGLRRSGDWPLVEGERVTYFYEGTNVPVRLTGDQFGWNPRGPKLNRLEGTDVHYLTLETPRDAYLEYKFILGDNSWIADPHNPDTNVGLPGEIPNSVLAMPEFFTPTAAAYHPDIPHGRLDTLVRDSSTYEELVRLIVYLPPGYDSSGVDYPTVYFQDGEEQITRANTVNSLDYLIDRSEIEPVVAVFTAPNDRNRQYAFDNREGYARFFATTLVDRIDSTYRTRKAATERSIVGPSFGGHISVLTAYTHPGVFGHCGAHSVSYWVDDKYLMDFVENRLDRGVNYVALWGKYDGVAENNEAMIDRFREKGYEMNYTVLPLGHTWKLWEAGNVIFLREILGNGG